MTAVMEYRAGHYIFIQ